jgi:hypothetical protein
VDEISFEVEGLPPAKNEASSMFAARHSHAARVHRLLEAAGIELQRTAWEVTSGPVGLNLTVRSGPGSDPWDATNYLGGVADVLQDKSRDLPRLDLGHLGPLRSVALYLNDRQLKEVHYREEVGTRPSYVVRVWRLLQEGSDQSG